MADICGVQAHFAVSAWFLFIGRGVRQQGMLPLQDGSHKDCLLFVPQTTMRQSYDIFAKWQREKENKYKMVIIALKEAAQTTIKIFFLRICFKIIKR